MVQTRTWYFHNLWDCNTSSHLMRKNKYLVDLDTF